MCHSSRCAYVMVCELDENRILAEFMLGMIMKFMQEHVTSHEQGNAEVSEYQYSSKHGIIRLVTLRLSLLLPSIV